MNYMFCIDGYRNLQKIYKTKIKRKEKNYYHNKNDYH